MLKHEDHTAEVPVCGETFVKKSGSLDIEFTCMKPWNHIDEDNSEQEKFHTGLTMYGHAVYPCHWY